MRAPTPHRRARRARALGAQLHRRSRDRACLPARTPRRGCSSSSPSISHDFADGMNTVSFILRQSGEVQSRRCAGSRSMRSRRCSGRSSASSLVDQRAAPRLPARRLRGVLPLHGRDRPAAGGARPPVVPARRADGRRLRRDGRHRLRRVPLTELLLRELAEALACLVVRADRLVVRVARVGGDLLGDRAHLGDDRVVRASGRAAAPRSMSRSRRTPARRSRRAAGRAGCRRGCRRTCGTRGSCAGSTTSGRSRDRRPGPARRSSRSARRRAGSRCSSCSVIPEVFTIRAAPARRSVPPCDQQSTPNSRRSTASGSDSATATPAWTPTIEATPTIAAPRADRRCRSAAGARCRRAPSAGSRAATTPRRAAASGRARATSVGTKRIPPPTPKRPGEHAGDEADQRDEDERHTSSLTPTAASSTREAVA